jgi:hypothetical protein
MRVWNGHAAAYNGSGVVVWAGPPPQPHGAHPAEPSTAADAFQRPLRSRFQARLSAGVRAPSEAWRFLQGASPCGVRSNQPLLPSVAPVKEVETERHR